MKCTPIFTVFIAVFIQTGWANEACSASKPDFKAGHRISEAKCREYNWEKKCSSSPGNDVNEHPYLGAIAYKKNDGSFIFACAATLVSPNFAVTTAHCLQRQNKPNVTPEFVRFGNKNLKAESVIDAKVVNIISHPRYRRPFYQYDIGLLEFESALPVNHIVAPACLWLQEISNDATTVSAWATIRGNEPSDVLKTMRVQIIDSDTCEPSISSMYNRKFKKLEDHHLCVNESDPDEYFCAGSSGAPIVASVPIADGMETAYLQAFVTFGKCTRGISIYTKVSNFVGWIEQLVWGFTPL